MSSRFVNANKPERWKADIAASVDFYNKWFLQFSPTTYQETRLSAVAQVEETFRLTSDLTRVTADVLQAHPHIVQVLRMTTAPPLARDRLTGLSNVPTGLVGILEKGRLPKHLPATLLQVYLQQISNIIVQLLDRDILPWLKDDYGSTDIATHRAATIVADRLCGAQSDPLIRNAQEQRQLATLKQWLEARGYRYVTSASDQRVWPYNPGTFGFRVDIVANQQGGKQSVNIPVDAIVVPHGANLESSPLLIEAKSAGDFTNPNKRRKEEATKVHQLRATYGPQVRFVLLLCGYFNSGYLGYEAAEGIDWVWEHRLDDLADFGL